MSKLVYIGSDHAGFPVKMQVIEYLKKNDLNLEIIDVGCSNTNSCDYPDFAAKLAENIINSKNNKQEAKGILICSTGIGIGIGVNRFDGITCVLVHNEIELKQAKSKLKANVISLGGKILGADLIQNLALEYIK